MSKRMIQIALGVLWLLDGVLQLQPRMFSRNFAEQVIAPAGQGQPWLVAAPIHLVTQLILWHPALFDAGFGLLQLALGALILYRPTLRLGLWASVIWGVAVWWLGEGMSGLLSGQASVLMGLPGAALLYAALALAVLPSRDGSTDRERRWPSYWLPLVWAAIWIGGAIYQLLPMNNTTTMLSRMIVAGANGAPAWLAHLDRSTAHWVGSQGTGLIVALVVVQALVGGLVLLTGWWRRTGVILGVILALIFWFVGQNLGEYYTGLATDPSTPPLLILMGGAILGCRPLQLPKLWQRLQEDLTESLV